MNKSRSLLKAKRVPNLFWVKAILCLFTCYINLQ
uniref:Uncharacterized protein n=1 Tax=Rhizophora mucronata TaxID=61149 RepID=A0A2P2QLE2_RHIMU